MYFIDYLSDRLTIKIFFVLSRIQTHKLNERCRHDGFVSQYKTVRVSEQGD